MQRPPDQASLPGLPPISRQRFLDLEYRIDSVLSGVARRGRPGAQVAGELRQRPSHLELLLRKDYLLEREWNRPVAVKQQLPLGEPVFLERPAVERTHCLVQRVCL
jgi:hypothetical protein